MKKTKKIFAIVLVIINLFLIFSISADALSVSATTSPTGMNILTSNSNLLLSKSSKITVKCTKGYAMKVTFIKISKCTVKRSTGAGFTAWDSMIVYEGGSASFTIKTGALKNGLVTIKVTPLLGEAIAYTVTGTNTSCIGRTVV